MAGVVLSALGCTVIKNVNLYVELVVVLTAALFTIFYIIKSSHVNICNEIFVFSTTHPKMFPSKISTTRFCLSNTELFVTQVQQ